MAEAEYIASISVTTGIYQQMQNRKQIKFERTQAGKNFKVLMSKANVSP